jgi:hypothetical protein
MKADDLLSVFRNAVDDIAEPHFWSDDTFYLYLTDAIYKYCEHGKPIRDHSSELTILEYTADSPWADIDERILKIISANDSLSNAPIRVMDWDTYNGSADVNTSDYGNLVYTSRYPDATGSVHTLITGMEDARVRLADIPIANGTIKLVIDRYPLCVLDNQHQDLEGVPLSDQLNLLNWVYHKAYNHQDAELYNPEKSENAKRVFEKELEEVDSRRMKKRHKPNVTRYGGL